MVAIRAVVALTELLALASEEALRARLVAAHAAPARRAVAGSGHVVTSRSVRAVTLLSASDAVESRRTCWRSGNIMLVHTKQLHTHVDMYIVDISERYKDSEISLSVLEMTIFQISLLRSQIFSERNTFNDSSLLL